MFREIYFQLLFSRLKLNNSVNLRVSQLERRIELQYIFLWQIKLNKILLFFFTYFYKQYLLPISVLWKEKYIHKTMECKQNQKVVLCLNGKS